MVSASTRLMIIATGLAIVAVCGSPADQPPGAKAKIAAGAGSFQFTPDAKRPQHHIKVWTYRPEGLGPNSPIVFVMHGVKRDGKTYRDQWVAHSKKGGFLVAVPEFPEGEYPGDAYQQGNIRDRAGKPIPPERWTFTVIEKLFDQVKKLTGSKVEKYYLYGHSAGGQFVHRFVLFMPEARYARAIAANPGYYTFPTQDVDYPYGLKKTSITGKLPPSVFAREFVLLLGDRDTNRDDPDLRKTPQADAQGLTRFERGKNYFQTARQAAKAERAKFNWRQVTVPGVGHSNAKMAPAAAREFFAKGR
jgi:poly(3-hydroxybutyrate) depolymerase